MICEGDMLEHSAKGSKTITYSSAECRGRSGEYLARAS